MTVRPDDALEAHARACDDCRAAPPPLEQLRNALEAGAEPDAGRLTQLALSRLLPELRARAQTAFWHRLARVLGIALLPLPLVLAADVWLLGRVYELAAAWLPSPLAVYIVVSYAASALVVIGITYAAIPLLLARPVQTHEVASG
jgi:hypothetical protein